MTFLAADPVSSGRPYEISDVAGVSPTALDQFVGDTRFTIRHPSGDTGVISGAGSLDGDGVRFHEKDVDHAGKDVRVWRVVQHESGFAAATI